MRRHTKFGLKIFEIDFVVEIKLYWTFWPLPKALGGRDLKNCVAACAIHVSNSHTKSGWFSGKKIGPPTPHGTPKSRPLGMAQATE